MSISFCTENTNMVEQSNKEIHPILQALYPVIDGLGESLGPDYEFVLHDLGRPKESVIRVVNGQVTGRKVGHAIRDLVLTVLRSKKFNQDRLVNYLTKTSEGKMIKSTTILLRDDFGNTIGALCINMDMGKFLMVKNELDEICRTTDLDELTNGSADEGDEVSEDVIQILRQIIRKTISNYVIPVASMSKEDKIEIVRFLDEKGVFLIKGAVDYLANELNVSRYTVYNYLEEERTHKIK